METINITKAMQVELSLTEQDLIALEERKSNLVLDVTSEAGYKAARKERTERNGITKGIANLAIAGKKAIDEVRHQLIDRVENSYTGIIMPLEVEEVKRKAEADLKKQKEAERIAAIQRSIDVLFEMKAQAVDMDSEGIAGIIEAVDLIDCSEGFDELTQEALQAQKLVLSDLSIMLNQAISQEQLSAERKAMQLQQKELAEQAAARELIDKAQDRLNNLKMIPAGMFGKSSQEIRTKYNQVGKFEITELEFGSLTVQAKQEQDQVLGFLNNMANQQEMVEQAEANRKAAIEAPPAVTDQPEVELKPEIDNNIGDKKEILTQADYSQVHTFLKGAESSTQKVQLLHEAFVDSEGLHKMYALAKLRTMFTGK
jgi:predicted esterase YcpF (UPF0227 family)